MVPTPGWTESHQSLKPLHVSVRQRDMLSTDQISRKFLRTAFICHQYFMCFSHNPCTQTPCLIGEKRSSHHIISLLREGQPTLIWVSENSSFSLKMFNYTFNPRDVLIWHKDKISTAHLSFSARSVWNTLVDVRCLTDRSNPPQDETKVGGQSSCWAETTSAQLFSMGSTPHADTKTSQTDTKDRNN